MSRPLLGLLTAFGVACAVVTGGAQGQWQDVIRYLRHPKAETRLDAVEKLGEAGYVAAIEPVAPLINDPDDRVQAAALDAELSFFLTERIGGTKVLGVGGAKSRAQLAFDAGPLIRTATPASLALIDALIAAVRDENPRVRFDAVHAVGFIAEPPLPIKEVKGLIDGLDHYDPVIRMATARVLGRLGARDAGDKLVDTMADSNTTVRQFAVEAVGQVREDRALSTLRDFLEHGRGVTPNQLLLAMARIGSPDDLARFREHLADKNSSARRAAVEGLGRLADRESLDTIDRLFKNDKSDDVRLAAAYALQRLGQTQTHVIASMMVVEDLRDQAREYLFEFGRLSIPGIQSTLQVATDGRHRADLIQTAGYLGTIDDMPVVERFLTDRDQRVVRAATAAALRLRRKN